MRGQGRKLHVPPNSEPGRSGLVFSRKQFGRRIRRCASAPVTQNHFRQILSIDTATITLWRPARLANHLSSPEKPRERSGHATITVAENALQPNDSAADRQRRRIEHVCRASGACVRAGRNRNADGGSGWSWHIHRIETVGISSCNLGGRLGNDGQSATDKIAPDVGGEITADDPIGRGVVVISHPYSDNNIRSESDEPGVAIFLGGAGLSSNRDIWKTRRFPGPLIHDTLQQVEHDGSAGA